MTNWRYNSNPKYKLVAFPRFSAWRAKRRWKGERNEIAFRGETEDWATPQISGALRQAFFKYNKELDKIGRK